MQHDFGVGESPTFATFSHGQQETSHAGGLADAHSRNGRANVLHGVVDRQAGSNLQQGGEGMGVR